MLQLMGSQRVGHDLGLNKKNNTKIQRMGKTKILTHRLIFLKRHYPTPHIKKKKQHTHKKPQPTEETRQISVIF